MWRGACWCRGKRRDHYNPSPRLPKALERGDAYNPKELDNQLGSDAVFWMVGTDPGGF